MKKILFFWTLFHLIGYSSYLTEINPKIDIDKTHYNQFMQRNYNEIFRVYLITPKYESYGESICCNSQSYSESENFWPIHKFTYGYYGGSGQYDAVEGFIGIFGYYGHSEFMFYVLLPYLILGLIWIYKRFVKN